MNKQQDQLETLHEIRNIMDRSSRFISLSGLSGVAAGVAALLGAAVVKWQMVTDNVVYGQAFNQNPDSEILTFLLVAGLLIFLLALGAASFFTFRNARKINMQVWNSQTRRMLSNLFIPMAAGGIFCGVLLFHGQFLLVPPAMLVFYGCALFNASKYTISEIRVLGLLEIGLGLLAGFAVEYGLLAWTIGFGVLHVVFGALVYFKYER